MADGEQPGVIRSACPYCGVGCGVELSGARDRLQVRGDRGHPANAGLLCSKGSALGETVALPGRLLHPVIGGARARGDEATRRVARRFRDTIAAHGPDSVALYVSGQLLTEDYYAANKLMKGFIGSANIDTNSRLCMASAVAAQKLAFGEDVVPACYEDLELADLVVLTGHNAAWTHPVLYRRMETAIARGQRHIVIDPRRTETAQGAWLHVPLRADTDVRLWNGLLAFLDARGALDQAYIAAHTEGWAALRSDLAAADQSLASVAADCGLEEDALLTFYAAFADTPRTVTLFSQGANQSVDGVAKGLAVINAHLATGRVSKPGASPFSITGQPNAMGGRETGGLANQLAAHMDFDPGSIDRVRRYWAAPRMATGPGLKAVDMFEAVHDGRIKAIWIMATNPAVSMPDSNRVRAALERCPFVVVSDVMETTDTTRFAHVLLPAQAWGEKDGSVTNSERRISRQRAALPAPGEARADWRIIADVARDMGWREAFGWAGAADIFREWAGLTSFENDGERVLNLGPLARISDRAYEAMAPVQWPCAAPGRKLEALAQRPYADGVFSHRGGRARFLPAHSVADLARSEEWPLRLNTGRERDQWHTMTRTGLAPRLTAHAPEPTLDVHPDDARAAGVRHDDIASLESAWGAALWRVRETETVRRGEVFVPIHWTDDTAPGSRSNVLAHPAADARSGQPGFKNIPVRVRPAAAAWRGWWLTLERRDPPGDVHWRRRVIATESGLAHRYELTALAGARGLAEVGAALMRDGGENGGVIEMRDSRDGFLRFARIVRDRLHEVFVASKGPRLPSADALCARLGAEISDAERIALLSGGVARARARIVCACFDVDAEAIAAFAASTPGADVAACGKALRAGSNCGSCRPEIARLIAETTPEKGPPHDVRC